MNDLVDRDCYEVYVTAEVNKYFHRISGVSKGPGSEPLEYQGNLLYWEDKSVRKVLLNPLFEEIDNFTDIWALKRQGKKLEIY